MTNCEMPYDDNKVTLYNPLHNKVNIIPEKLVSKYLERISYNKYLFEDKDGNKKICFKKFITLVDYVKYLIGKYKPEEMEQLPSEENLNNLKESTFTKYINSEHNYAYVDGYFYYLTSKLLEKGFVHGLEYYDNYISITNNCELNISDDFEYLSDSNFFNENINKLFYFKDPAFVNMYNNTQPSVQISNEEILIETDTLDDLVIEKVEIIEENELEESTIEIEEYKNAEYNSDNDSDHSTVDLSDDEMPELTDIESIRSNSTE